MPNEISQQNIYGVASQPGIWRDWTINSSPGYTDGQFCRFYHGRPKKIGGWEELGDIGLTPNLTYFTNNLKAYANNNAVVFGEIRSIRMYPISERYVVVLAVDILNVPNETLIEYDPNTQIVPSGLFIGITNDTLTEQIQFYPIRFQKNFQYNSIIHGNAEVNFTPGAYNWHLSFYGVTSGGEVADPLTTNVNSSPLSSLALVAHAADTLQDKMNTNNSYVYFGYLSDLIDFGNSAQYVEDVNLSTATPPSPAVPASEDPRYMFAPMMFPMTSLPVGGFFNPGNPTVSSPTPVVDPNNPYILPKVFDPRSIYCTSEVYVSGGVTSIGPFLFAYGNNGLVRNCSSNNPEVWFNLGNKYFNFNPGVANDDNMDNYKVVHCLPVRGGAGTSALAWTSNSLWLIQYTGAAGTYFAYYNISNSISILSANAVVEQNGIYYWIGEDNFYTYSGTVQVATNNHNFIWFYENLNYDNRAKTFSFKNPRFSEIWWVFPKGRSTEPNWAIVYNYQENFWYDTPWERTSGTYDQAFYQPLCCGDIVSAPTPITYVDGSGNIVAGQNYQLFNFRPVWVHERGYNQVTQNGIFAIDGFIITCDIGYLNGGPNKNMQGVTNNAFLPRIDPDSMLVGEQYIQVLPRQYPGSEDNVDAANIRTYGENTEFTDYLSFSEMQGRIIRIKYGCNTIDGTFYLGKPLITLDIGDTR